MSAADTRAPPHQPFQCLICSVRFTRHENLKRHSQRHSRSQENGWLACELCAATFSRDDLRHRHMRRKHPEHVGRSAARGNARREPRLSASPASTHPDWLRYDEGELGLSDDLGPSRLEQSRVTYSGATTHPITEIPSTSLEPEVSVFNLGESIAYRTSSASPPQVQDDWAPSAAQLALGCELFFSYVAHYVPCLHQATFSASQASPHLLLAMLSLAYQHGEDPELGSQPGTGALLSRQCFHRARGLLALFDEDTEEPIPHVSIVQSYLLLQICAMMYLCGKDASYGLRMHSKMILYARMNGLMQPAPDDARGTGDLESLWRDFIERESIKRTVFAVHQIDALWYQILSVPRQLSHLEVKHDLPCPEQLWRTSSAAEWAHQQLISRQSGPLLKYPDAVRRFLSADVDPGSLPPFDPYGAINITQFLISSAREISGWCTMTGMVSLDRFAPLKASLAALGQFIFQQPMAVDSPHPNLCEVTWQTAMIELLVWSPSHVGGIVEGSIDSLLRQSTYLSPHTEILTEPSVVGVIQPHVDWFLHYLDSTVAPNFEAPWVTLYAYKIFLIAWQLVQRGTPGAMKAVGIRDGDVEGALAWARKVFQRRQTWQLGRLVMECLDSLGEDALRRVTLDGTLLA